MVRLFDSYCGDDVSAVCGVQYTSDRYGCELVTLFDSHCYDGVSSGAREKEGDI